MLSRHFPLWPLPCHRRIRGPKRHCLPPHVVCIGSHRLGTSQSLASPWLGQASVSIGDQPASARRVPFTIATTSLPSQELRCLLVVSYKSLHRDCLEGTLPRRPPGVTPSSHECLVTIELATL